MNTDSGPVTSPGEGGPVVDSAVRLRLDISYDGTGFAGWAVQPGRRTVAGVLGDALAVLFREQVRLVVAGRTDAGVHASGQVAHIDVPVPSLVGLTPRHLPQPGPDAAPGAADPGVLGGCSGLLRRLAGLLPPDVRVRVVAPVPGEFDARFSALRRHYRYRICTAPWGADPLRRVDVLVHSRPLDAAAMSMAGGMLLGLHDFATYCKPRPGATTIRELQQLAVRPTDHGVEIDVSADAFCHSMVRALVGALIAVGEGRDGVTRPAELLAARSRSSAVHTAPARGLTLIGVDYPPDSELAARAAATRAVRPSVVDDEPADPGS